MSFSGKVVLVANAASEIGVATAELFARKGAAVAIVDKDSERIQVVADRIARDGHNTFTITANVADEDDTRRIVKETVDKYGKLDILINCAGIYRTGSIVDNTITNNYDDIFDTNLRAVILLTTEASAHIARTKGNVINISNINTECILDMSKSAYNVSKVGVDHFTMNAALELASCGVRVNAIRPGPVRKRNFENASTDDNIESTTSFNVSNRVNNLEEIANLALYLASDKAKSITGSIFNSDNGMVIKYS